MKEGGGRQEDGGAGREEEEGETSPPPLPPPTIVNLRAFLSPPPALKMKEGGGKEEGGRREEGGMREEGGRREEGGKEEGGKRVENDVFWKEDAEEVHRKVKTHQFAQRFFMNVEKNARKESLLMSSSKNSSPFAKKLFGLDMRQSLLKSKIKDIIVKKKEEGLNGDEGVREEGWREGGGGKEVCWEEGGGREEGGKDGGKRVGKKEGLFELIKKMKKKDSVQIENPYENLAGFEEIRLPTKRLGTLVVVEREEEGEGCLKEELEKAKKKKIGEVKRMIEEEVGRGEGMEVQLCKLFKLF